MVVTDVSIIARPTLLIEIREASSGDFPDFLSSLYLWRLWRLSSISRASINIGSRFENWDLKMNSNPVFCPKMIAQPISPYIQAKERVSAVDTMATSEILLRLIQSKATTANDIVTTR